MKYNLVVHEDDKNITVFVDGEVRVTDGSHPRFNEIVERCIAGDETVIDLFDVTRVLQTKLEPLSERVSVAGGKVYFDGDAVDGPLGNHIVRMLEENEDFDSLVLFLEKLMQNPNQHSREQLYEWLQKHDFSITENGDIAAYKGVRRQDGGYVSVNSGVAYVNGERYEGQIPNNLGDEVTMPRSEVQFDPAVGCSTGLHAANWAYASHWGELVLRVDVNPRDVVSVPTDSDHQKLRTCRYRVVEEVHQPWSYSIWPSYDANATDYDSGYYDYEDLNY